MVVEDGHICVCVSLTESARMFHIRDRDTLVVLIGICVFLCVFVRVCMKFLGSHGFDSSQWVEEK